MPGGNRYLRKSNQISAYALILSAYKYTTLYAENQWEYHNFLHINIGSICRKQRTRIQFEINPPPRGKSSHAVTPAPCHDDARKRTSHLKILQQIGKV
jgi:hypothetical protein